MSAARLIALGVLANVLVLALAIGGSYALSLRALTASQRAQSQLWCPVLALSQRAPGELHPTRAQRRAAAAFRADLAALRQRFGC